MEAMGMLTSEAAAKFATVSPRSLEKWRLTGGGPRFVKLGRRVAYDPRDLAAWLEKHKVGSTAEAVQRA